MQKKELIFPDCLLIFETVLREPYYYNNKQLVNENPLKKRLFKSLKIQSGHKNYIKEVI